jgi:uncharacterized low-complexity protein
MRIHRFLFVTMVAAKAFVPATVWADEVAQVDHIVSTQVLSDEVVSNGSIGESIVADGSCANGECASGGSACADGRCVGNGQLGGRLGIAASYIGDLARTGFCGDIESGCVPRTYGYPDLFYNYYTQGECNSTNAQMYISPVPVPPNVGHTFYTYQPFMPHEMLYWHKDRYHNYYDGGRGMNHTKVHYYGPPVRTAASNIYWNYLRIPR